MKIENIEIGVIKWERVWNDDREKYGERERERERAIDDTYCYNCEPNCRGEQSFFIAKLFFLGIMKLGIICVMSTTS